MTISDILTNLCTRIAAETSSGDIQLANIAAVNDGDQFFATKSPILLSIVNIEEDKISKNQNLHRPYNDKTMTTDRYKKASQSLVLSILFSSYNKDALGDTIYSNGLVKLEEVIRYLQHNNVFYYDNAKLYEQTDNDIPTGEAADGLNKLIIDMVSLKMEQLNQMWSFLGSRYMPSVLYTMRLIPIQNESTVPVGKVIDKTKIQLWENDVHDPTGLIEESKDFTKQ